MNEERTGLQVGVVLFGLVIMHFTDDTFCITATGKNICLLILRHLSPR